jgi:hypothetical protein
MLENEIIHDELQLRANEVCSWQPGIISDMFLLLWTSVNERNLRTSYIHDPTFLQSSVFTRGDQRSYPPWLGRGLLCQLWCRVALVMCAAPAHQLLYLNCNCCSQFAYHHVTVSHCSPPLARDRGGGGSLLKSPTIVTFFVRSRGHCSRKPLDTYTWTSFDVGWRYLPDIPSALQLCHWDQTTPCCSYCSTSSHPVTWSYQTDDSCDREELSVVWELEDCAHETARNEEMFFLEVQ